MRVVGIALAIAIGATVPGVYWGWDSQPVGSTDASLVLDDPWVKEYEWSTAAALEDVAFEVRTRVEEVAECRLVLSAAGRTTSGGPEFVKVVRTDEGRGWSAMSQDGSVQGHVEGVADTRGVAVQTEAHRWAMTSEHRRPDMVGNFSWFFAARSLAPWVGHEWSGADSLRFRFACDHPFRVEEVLAAQGARLVDEASLAGGRSLRVVFAGTYVQGDGVRMELASPSARLMLGVSDTEGTLSLTLPQGLRELDLGRAESFYAFAQGAGAYGLELDCFCQGTLWAVLADLVATPDLSHVLRATD